MIFISAQPDTDYFIWQLEILLRNMKSFNIQKEEIHVLVGYDKKKGLNSAFNKFIIDNNHLAMFFIYPDTRKNPQYISSIRPHILKQHFKKYPKLSEETLFYHDSDILFSRIPNISDVDKNEICYVSNTRNYMDINYILTVSSNELLMDMLSIVGITLEKVEHENENTGGAQYILKGITAKFWDKVEEDSENLYILMKKYNTQLWEDESIRGYKSDVRGIQEWCSDMWAVLWNLWLTGKKVKVHSEMEFSWPFSPIAEWTEKSIQHYSGNIEDRSKYFKKGEYVNYMPWYDKTLDSIPNTNCSYQIVQFIKKRRNELDLLRPKYENILVLLEAEVLDDESLQILEINKAYIQKYFNINVFILTSSLYEHQNSKDNIICKDNITSNVNVITKYKSFLIIPHNLLIRDFEFSEILLKKEQNQIVKFSNGYEIDKLFTESFSKMLEIDLITDNIGKFNQIIDKKSVYIFDLISVIQYFKSVNCDLEIGMQIDTGFVLT